MTPDTPPPRRTRSRLRRAGLAAGVLVVAAAGLEAALRLGAGLGRPPLLQADPEIGYVFRADQDLRRFGRRVAINGFHQRSDPVAPAPAPGVFRVLCVGDSVTWGGVQTDQAETYPEQLRGLLAADHPGRGVEVLNASAGSWGLGNQAAYLRRFGTFGSRAVVLQVGSHDLLQPTSTGVGVGVAAEQPDRNPPAALAELWTRYLGPRLSRAAGADPPPAAGPPRAAPDDEAAFAANMAALRECVGLARAGGAAVVVLHTPGRDEVAPPAGPAPGPFAPFRGRFLDACRELGVPVVNLAEEWVPPAPAATYFRDEVHPNPAGNRAMAERVRAALR